MKGFRAYVQVYNEMIYVNTFTGEGFDKVLVKMNPLLRKLSSKVYLPGYTAEDVKSELSIILLEGIYYFDPDRKVRLNTFLHTHLHNKMVSWIKSENKLSNDAVDSVSAPKEDINGKKFRIAKREVGFSQFKTNDNNEFNFESCIPDEGGLISTKISDYDLVNFENDLLKLSSKLDDKTRQIIELMYFEDCSIKDAAEKVGLSGWAASMRLKKLASRGIFKSIFE